MHLSDSIAFVSGWYASEGTHIWCSKTGFIHIQSALGQQVNVYVSLARRDQPQRLRIIDVNHETELMSVALQNDGNISFLAPSNDFLCKIVADDFIIPAFQNSPSNDMRKLAFSVADVSLSPTETTKLLQQIQLDKPQSEMLFNFYYDKQIYHESDFKFYENFSQIDAGVFLDIGANIGQSAVSFAHANGRMKILSFEPNATLAPNLTFCRALLRGQMEFYLYGIGKNDQEHTFYVPKAEESYFTQEGSFDPKEFANANWRKRIQPYLKNAESPVELAEFNFEIKKLSDKTLCTYFVKIDTQGKELDVLDGLQSLIERCRPVIMIEKSSDRQRMTAVSNKLPNYRLYYYHYADNRLGQTDSCSPNYFLVPRKLTKNKAVNKLLKQLIA